MKILVICGAGASSTFVAHRLRLAARKAGSELQASAGTEASLPIDIEQADVLLVGAHLSAGIERIRAAAAARNVLVEVLPDDIATDLDGTRALEIVHHATSKGASASANERD